MKTTLRTHSCGDLRATNENEKVTLAGWVHRRRDHGGTIFVDLRDRFGLTQVVFDAVNNAECLKIAEDVRSEWVIRVTGVVKKRGEGLVNAKMLTGEIEIAAEKIEIINKSKTPPFEVVSDDDANEEIRFKYRYLDLRRRKVLNFLQVRADVMHTTREFFREKKFLEVQTPILAASTPEGARDMLVPSRAELGKFFALPQSPQQFKQLLMCGGIDRYFQIAPCFRDEDGRADRMLEHYQLDLEMSFVIQDDIFALMEPYFHTLISKNGKQKFIPFQDFPKLTYAESAERFGSDKPDIRFGCEIVDVSAETKKCGFGVFEGSEIVHVLKISKNKAEAMRSVLFEQKIAAGDEEITFSRKDIDELTEVAKQLGAKGLAWLKVGEESGPVAKNMTAESQKVLAEKLGAKDGDILFFGAGSDNHQISQVLDRVRLTIRDKFDLVNRDELAFCWITDMPFFEWDEDRGKIDFGHNPFSMPAGGKAALVAARDGGQKELLDLKARQYDLACNGFEMFSGGERNFDPESLRIAFEIVGYEPDFIKKTFGHMMEAFEFGAPPHAGVGMGLDRVLMMILGTDNIRELTPFPKDGRGRDLLMNSPSEVLPEQLLELGIEVCEKE